MKNNRRDFLKRAGLTGLSLAGARLLRGFPAGPEGGPVPTETAFAKSGVSMIQEGENISVIGPYGRWAASLIEKELPSLSFRRKEWRDRTTWHRAADQRVRERLAIPDIGVRPEVRVKKQYVYDGLHIEELSWQLPYGRPTDAILLKPADAGGQGISRGPGIGAGKGAVGQKHSLVSAIDTLRPASWTAHLKASTASDYCAPSHLPG